MMLCRTFFSIILLFSIVCVWVATDVSASTGQGAGEDGGGVIKRTPGPTASCPAGEGSDVNCPSESAETSCSPDANDGRTCAKPEAEKAKTNVSSAAAGPSGGRSEQGSTGHATATQGPRREPGLPDQMSVVSSSSGQGQADQLAETLRDQDTENNLDDRASERSVSNNKEAEPIKKEQEQDEQLKNTVNEEQRPPAGDSKKPDTSVSQTNASSTTPSREETAGGSHLEEPSAPTPQNTGDTPSNSSTVDNPVGSDAANNVSNAATSSAESASTSNHEGDVSNTTTTTTT
ncbi:uncharacterized protein TM35_000511170, partial [Trypanosoma theileri]